MRRLTGLALTIFLIASGTAHAQRYTTADGRLRVALVKQPFSPTGTSAGPNTMANGGIRQILEGMGVVVRMDEAALTAEEATEYGGWKRLGMALGHFADIVAKNERDGYFTVGLLATCPSMPGLVAGLQHSGPTRKPIKIGMLWLDAHPDFNTPETTRSGSLGGMPVAVATGRALQQMRLDAHLNPPLQDRHIVMGGVRLTDPLEQQLLDRSSIQQLSVDDLRNMTPAVFAQLERLSRLTDKIYVHIDMDVLDPREVMGHGNKVPNGPSSEQLAKLFEAIFKRYSKASAIGFATIPSTDEGGLSLAAVNRMIEGAIRGLKARELPSKSGLQNTGQTEQFGRNFPTADFNEADPVDPEKRTAHKQKQKRHNGLGLVDRNPGPDSGGAAFMPEWQFDFPALPVARSDIIVVGEVLDATAHLSEDKTNVYSEFTIRVGSVLKTNTQLKAEIVVERLGGYVRYPNGQKLLYFVGTGAMPRVGGRYVFFLDASSLDVSIITAYEFNDGKVTPLDPSGQFDKYRGFDEAAFLRELHKALVKP